MPQSGSLTYADLASFPDDGLRRELIDGELIVSPSPRTRHQELVRRLVVTISNYLEKHGGGRVFIAPLDVVLSNNTVLEPDLLFVADEQIDIITEMNIQGAPALAIEVVSDSRYDRVRKRDIYARFSVQTYWIIDPDSDRVEVHRLSGERFTKPEILEPGETLTFAALPGLAIDLTALFAR